jgi:hypothetical protein
MHTTGGKTNEKSKNYTQMRLWQIQKNVSPRVNNIGKCNDHDSRALLDIQERNQLSEDHSRLSKWHIRPNDPLQPRHRP